MVRNIKIDFGMTVKMLFIIYIFIYKEKRNFSLITTPQNFEIKYKSRKYKCM